MSARELQENPAREQQEDPAGVLQEDPARVLQEAPARELQEDPAGELQEDPAEEMQEDPATELQEDPAESGRKAQQRSCRKFQGMVIQQPAVIKRREATGQGESGSEARQPGSFTSGLKARLTPRTSKPLPPPHLYASVLHLLPQDTRSSTPKEPQAYSNL